MAAAVAAVLFVYKGDAIKPILSKLSPDNNEVDGIQNPVDTKIKTENEILDRVAAKLKSDGKNEDRTIVKSDSAGGGGEGIRECAVQKSKIGDLDYFVRAKITEKESVFDEASGQTLTYIYADVDEYEKVTGTTFIRDNESGLLITNTNLTEEDYDAAKANIPDLNPEQLLIIAVPDSEINGQDTDDFANVYLRYDNNLFSTTC